MNKLIKIPIVKSATNEHIGCIELKKEHWSFLKESYSNDLHVRLDYNIDGDEIKSVKLSPIPLREVSKASSQCKRCNGTGVFVQGFYRTRCGCKYGH